MVEEGSLSTQTSNKYVTDEQIKKYLNEEKILPKDFKPTFRDRNGHNWFEKKVDGRDGDTFKIIIRQSNINPLDFSVILGVLINGNLFRLKRYNGNAHEHTNKLEKEHLDGFHVHMATERYQENGFREEGFAQMATHYNDWKSALNRMIEENNFRYEIDGAQKRLS